MRTVRTNVAPDDGAIVVPNDGLSRRRQPQSQLHVYMDSRPPETAVRHNTQQKEQSQTHGSRTGTPNAPDLHTLHGELDPTRSIDLKSSGGSFFGGIRIFNL